jgi:hypothetical protein
MKKAGRFFLSTLLSLIPLFLPSPIWAQTTKSWDILQTELGGGDCVIDGVATIQGTMCVLANVLSVSLTVIGLAGFVMMIVGSLTWLLSGGNSQNVEKARKTMTFAIVGLVVALSSYMIIRLIAEFTGISILEEFSLPNSETNWTNPTPTP